MSELRVALTDALGPLYRVEREVRPMDEYRLFVATEIPTGPELLVKVLPATVSLNIDAQRFEREVLLLADQLRQENLVPPRGAGRAGPFVFHTRPFIEGTTLLAWMTKSGPAPLARAVEIIGGVLRGLAHAHKNKIAHGELRPENVLLSGNSAAVADCGMAQLTGNAASPAEDMATLGALFQRMLSGQSHRVRQEPLERTRTLPPWLVEWMQTEWTDAGKALAALRLPPPPPPSSGPLKSPQPVA